MSPIIEVTHVSKTFPGGTQALSNVSFAVGPGEIVGLLGPNGSGKSTLMKIMAGLLHADHGSVSFFGQPLHALPQPIQEIGLLLDPSWLDTRLNCRSTIKTHAAITGNAKAFANPEAALAQVGLSQAVKRPVAKLSLGMRQRLALAVALLTTPKLMILDEPINGLDPDGILHVRQLLTSFRDQGGSILLSSHLMTEMQLVADRVVILKKGHKIAEGSLDSLGGRSTVECRCEGDLAALTDLLLSAGIEHESTVAGDLRVFDVPPAEVFRLAVRANVVLTSLGTVTRSLEESYAALTADSTPNPQPAGVHP